MLKSVAIFCAVLALAKGQSTAVSRCTFYGGDLPINIYIEGCTTPPCPLQQNRDAIINIIFQAPHNIRTLRTLAGAFLPGIAGLIPLPYDLGDQSVTCNFLTNTYCPLVKGEVVQYTLRMFILEAFPAGTQVSVEFRIVDENNTNIMCVRVPIRIVAATQIRDGGLNATITDFN